MAEEKKDTEKKAPAKKPAAKKPAAKKPAASAGSRSAAKKPAAKAKETATGGSGSAAKASSKTADTKGSEKSTSKAPAKKPAAKKPAAKAETKAKAPARKPAAKGAPAKQEAPERPVVSARARFVRVAPRKARLVADQVRGLALDDALPLLRFSTRSAAQDIRKLIESAAANAEANHDLVADDLFIKDIHVDEGPTLRRYRPRALGRATRINKRTSHIAVALTPED
jgi:large subunit ribosomal protein L22